jgi:hypothetical protein
MLSGAMKRTVVMKPYLASQQSYLELFLVLQQAGTAEMPIIRCGEAFIHGPAMLIDTVNDPSGTDDHLHSNRTRVRCPNANEWVTYAEHALFVRRWD